MMKDEESAKLYEQAYESENSQFTDQEYSELLDEEYSEESD